MAKLVPYGACDFLEGYLFWCPGCEEHHGFRIAVPEGSKCPTVWHFDGNMEQPTFSPSLLVTSTRGRGTRCHLFLKGGKIQFLNDCKHHLAGKTVELL